MYTPLRSVHCPHALLADGWATNVLIQFGVGIIHDVKAGVVATPESFCLDGPVIPGMANVHSHSFQRAMAGLAERRGNSDDNFWVWRDAMYQFAERLGPEDVAAVAEQLYVELLRNGYTSVGEFHYLHHAPDGTPYADPAELSLRHVAAARETGMRLTHLPVLYTRGGFDGRALEGAQRRFHNEVEELLAIRACLLDECESDPTINVGVALHSLRAVSSEQISATLAGVVSQERGGAQSVCPVHIHIAEQIGEVNDCQAALGARPIEWLLSNHPVDAKWCLIHATHVTTAELPQLARSQANVGLCPTTEANLGDGIFPAVEFRRLPTQSAAGGRLCIGSDSHISTSPVEELRLLEYGQRLAQRQRNLLAEPNQSVGASLYQHTASNGAAALGYEGGRIEVGAAADLVVLRDTDPLLAGREGDAVLDTYVFAGDSTMVRDVIVGGRHIVQDGAHPRQEAAATRFRERIGRIASSL